MVTKCSTHVFSQHKTQQYHILFYLTLTLITICVTNACEIDLQLTSASSHDTHSQLSIHGSLSSNHHFISNSNDHHITSDQQFIGITGTLSFNTITKSSCDDFMNGHIWGDDSSNHYLKSGNLNLFPNDIKLINTATLDNLNDFKNQQLELNLKNIELSFEIGKLILDHEITFGRKTMNYASNNKSYHFNTEFSFISEITVDQRQNTTNDHLVNTSTSSTDEDVQKFKDKQNKTLSGYLSMAPSEGQLEISLFPFELNLKDLIYIKNEKYILNLNIAFETIIARGHVMTGCHQGISPSDNCDTYSKNENSVLVQKRTLKSTEEDQVNSTIDLEQACQMWYTNHKCSDNDRSQYNFITQQCECKAGWEDMESCQLCTSDQACDEYQGIQGSKCVRNAIYHESTRQKTYICDLIDTAYATLLGNFI